MRSSDAATTPDVLLAAAREYAQEGRASHVAWVEHLSAGPCDGCTPESLRAIGTVDDQREWVRKYDVILTVLDLVDETLAVRMVDAVARLADSAERDSRRRNAQHALRYRREARSA